MNQSLAAGSLSVSDSSPLELPSGVEISRLGIVLPDTLAYESWQEILGRLAVADQGLKWALADMLNFGEKSYGGKYKAAIEATGLDYDTLKGYCWIAGKVEMVRRRHNLGFSHHKEVAPLHPLEQIEWLDKAISEAYSVRKLREEIAASKGKKKPGDATTVAHLGIGKMTEIDSSKPASDTSKPASDTSKPASDTSKPTGDAAKTSESRPTTFADASPVEIDLKTGKAIEANRVIEAKDETAPFLEMEEGEPEPELEIVEPELERIPEGTEAETPSIGSGGLAGSGTLGSKLTPREIGAVKVRQWTHTYTNGPYSAEIREALDEKQRKVFRLSINGRRQDDSTSYLGAEAKANALLDRLEGESK